MKGLSAVLNATTPSGILILNACSCPDLSYYSIFTNTSVISYGFSGFENSDSVAVSV